jgi:hypothetical protein
MGHESPSILKRREKRSIIADPVYKGDFRWDLTND